MKKFKYSIVALATMVALSGCTHNLSQSTISHHDNTIIKSQFDTNQYKYIELDNGLKVLLISDPMTDKSAASLDVGVGAFHAKKGREGLFHFIEHMLFLGTEKYPEAGAYGKFLKKNGGSSNAYTANESTNYFFDVKNDAFDEALDRFSQFFIAPTFDKQFLEREKNAVQSEFSGKLKLDSRRIKEATRQTRNPEHPYSLFTVGDLTTLADDEENNTHAQVIAAFNRHYSANRMSLVVQSRQSIVALEQLVKLQFSAIKNNHLPAPVLNKKILTDEQLGTRVNIVPLKEQRSLTLFFPMPDTSRHFNVKPIQLINHFLQHQGEHSLFDSLRNKDWISAIKPRLTDSNALDSFEITFSLTAQGIKHVDDITKEFFTYINTISHQGVSAAYYQEIKKIAALDFRFKEKESPIWNVVGLSPLLKEVSVPNLLNAYYQYDEFKPELVQSYLKEFTPYNMQQVVVAPGLKTTDTEPRYSVDYGIEKIPSKLLDEWSRTSSGLQKLPSLNSFIAQDTMMKVSENEAVLPRIIIDKPNLKLWHANDVTFSLPKSQFRLNLDSVVARDTPKHRVLLALMTQIVNDNLRQYSYDAKLAGLSYELQDSSDGLTLHVKGFSDKQPDFIKSITTAITQLEVTAASFSAAKEELTKALTNQAFSSPLSQAFAQLNVNFGEEPYTTTALQQALTSLNEESVKEYARLFSTSIRAQAFYHGNVTEQESKALARYLEKLFSPSDHLVKLDLRKNKTLPLAGEHTVFVDNADQAITMAFPMEKSIEYSAKSLLLAAMIQGSFFAELRTKQQLGYSVGVSSRLRDNLPAIVFYIQSSNYSPNTLEMRINKFLHDQANILKNMNENQLNNYKDGVLSKLLAADNSLSDSNKRLWQQMKNNTLDFNDNQRIAQAIKDIKRENIGAMFKQLFLAKNSHLVIVKARSKGI